MPNALCLGDHRNLLGTTRLRKFSRTSKRKALPLRSQSFFLHLSSAAYRKQVYTPPMLEQLTKQHKIALGAVGAVLLIAIGFSLSGGWTRSATIPTGEQTVHAVITAAPISLDRRGTHMLMTGSTLFAFAESSTVNLRSFEGQTVEIVGTYELNIRPNDLPVVVVKSIKGNEPEWKNWSIQGLSLEIKTPKEWKVTKTASGADFTSSGSVHPVLSIHLTPLSETQFQSGDKRTVEGRRAFVTGDGGVVVLGVDRGSTTDIAPNKRLMAFTFDLGALGDDATAMESFERIIRSIRLGFLSDSSASSTSRSTYGGTDTPTSSGVGVGSPCGGEAGVLCPPGLYCEITDRDLNIGKCARL